MFGICSHNFFPYLNTLYYISLFIFHCVISHPRFGRKPVLFATMAVQVIFTVLEIFSPSWTVFAILLFINGLGQVSNYVSGFVLGKCEHIKCEHNIFLFSGPWIWIIYVLCVSCCVTILFIYNALISLFLQALRS